MKIEVCEHLTASWLKHIKGCQIVEKNWTPSPLSTQLDSDAERAIKAFIDDVKKEMDSNELDIFKKSTVNQFVMQCEIDVVGIKISDANVDGLYLVDSAFHENGLGYKKPVATVLKKLLRAVIVAGLIFKNIPPQVVFVAPKCGPTLKTKLEVAVAKLDGVVKKHYPSGTLTLLFNEDFYSRIYAPMIEQIDNISDDNELFLRSVKLSKIAESFAPKPLVSPKAKSPKATTTPPATTSSAAAKGMKIGRYAQYVYTELLKTGQLSPAQIRDLSDKKYCSKTFSLSYAVLADYASSADTKYYYKERVLGQYLICREWKDKSRVYIDQWIADNGFIV